MDDLFGDVPLKRPREGDSTEVTGILWQTHIAKNTSIKHANLIVWQARILNLYSRLTLCVPSERSSLEKVIWASDDECLLPTLALEGSEILAGFGVPLPNPYMICQPPIWILGWSALADWRSGLLVFCKIPNVTNRSNKASLNAVLAVLSSWVILEPSC